MGDQITWCDHDVTDDGVEYVKAERIAELEQHINKQGQEFTELSEKYLHLEQQLAELEQKNEKLEPVTRPEEER